MGMLMIAIIVRLLIDHQQQQQHPPDFAAISDIQARKQAFVKYLKPIIMVINRQRAQERRDLKSIYHSLQQGQTPSYWQRHQLKMWAKRYKISFDENKLMSVAKRLLRHLDQIPASMVLAQAALESAWGTSRFVRLGNNYFGQWCFVKGCGMIPTARAEDAKHEVKHFPSAKDSLATYFQNINTNPAYQQVREIRAQERQAGKSPSGLAMINGLVNYSQKGQAYIDDLRSVILSNHFEAPAQS